MPKGNTLYTGTPQDIIAKTSNEIVDALKKDNIYPSGILVISLLHVAMSVVVMSKEYNYGVMPSFRSMLMLMTSALTQKKEFTVEETELLAKEFEEIVKSLGGRRIDKDKPPIIMSPHGGVH